MGLATVGGDGGGGWTEVTRSHLRNKSLARH